METDKKNISVLSKGNLIEGYTADEVIANLSKQFKVSPAAAKGMLRKGAVLKKSASVEMAKKLVSVFRALGLEVGCVVTGPRPVASSAKKVKSAPTKAVQSPKKPVPPMSPEARKWRASFGENVPQPQVNPFHVILSSLAAFAGLLPAILYILIFSVLLNQFVGVAIATAGYMMGNAYGHIFSIVFNSLFLVVLAFLLVRIVQPRSEAEGKCVVNEKDAPSLYALLDVLCELTESPFPSEIVVTNRMEILLQPQLSITSLRSKDLSLSIGAPMLALKNRRQFIAVLVHELGHYSDSNKVPAYLLINFVSRWLENRSVMQGSLEVSAQHGVQANSQLPPAEWVWGKTNGLLRAYVTWVLRLSRKINRRVDGWLEYCADYYTAYVLGVDHFDEFSRDQTIAHATYQYVSDINAQAWQHHKLLCNIPAAVLNQYQQWSEDELQQLMFEPLEPTEDNQPVNPVSYSRIASVEKLGFKGVYKDTSPAASLFADFTSLCEKVTIEHYRQQYRDQDFTRYIVDNSKIVSMRESLGDAEIALEEFMGGAYAHRLIDFSKPLDSAQMAMTHQQTIDWIRKNLFEYRDHQKIVEELHQTRQDIRLLLSLIEVGVDVMVLQSSIERRSKRDLTALLSETDAQLEVCYKFIAAVDHMITKRIMMAVGKMSDQEKDSSRRYLGMVKKVGGFDARLRTLAEACVILRGLVAQDNPSGKLLMKIDASSSECRRLIDGILSEAATIAVFSDDDRRSLREYINSATKLDTKDLAELSFERVLGIADDIEKVVIYHYTHTLGQLAKQCHLEEKRLKIRPLKLITK